jgi:hypothetical protein
VDQSLPQIMKTDAMPVLLQLFHRGLRNGMVKTVVIGMRKNN